MTTTTAMTTTTTTERGGTNSAVATFEGGWLCSVEAGGFQLVVDEPVAVGGTGLGPMPTDLLLAALSSCYALALAWAARKRGLELPDLEVTATGSYAGQKFGALVLTVRSSLPAEQVEPLLEPAKRACYVSNTFAHVPEVKVALAAPTQGL
jgi:uncharacterized OsmC-like protein